MMDILNESQRQTLPTYGKSTAAATQHDGSDEPKHQAPRGAMPPKGKSPLMSTPPRDVKGKGKAGDNEHINSGGRPSSRPDGSPGAQPRSAD
jgi:hypothetical protein